MRKIFAIISLLAMTLSASALDLIHGNSYFARVAYNLGGAAPLDLPASIRGLNSYKFCPNFILGVDGFHPFNDRWGMMAGIHFENKGMNVGATVKNYKMTIVRGGESLSGVFTGYVVTKEIQSLITIPVQATLDLGTKWRLKLGPYFSYTTSHSFTGYAYDGYLRQGNPTGPKVLLGTEEGSRGDFDFSESMRNFQWGWAVGADWYVGKRWGAFAGLNWGMNGVFQSDFNVIEQTMYPIYGEIGVLYRMK